MVKNMFEIYEKLIYTVVCSKIFFHDLTGFENLIDHRPIWCKNRLKFWDNCWAYCSDAPYRNFCHYFSSMTGPAHGSLVVTDCFWIFIMGRDYCGFTPWCGKVTYFFGSSDGFMIKINQGSIINFQKFAIHQDQQLCSSSGIWWLLRFQSKGMGLRLEAIMGKLDDRSFAWY